MSVFSIFFIALVAIVTGLLLHFLFRSFRLSIRWVAVFSFPVLLFLVGFILRLSDAKEYVDVGFFFTEYAFLYGSVLLWFAMLAGQIKYWDVKV